MKDGLIISLLSIVPRNLGARLMGAFARTGLSSLVKRWFVRRFQLNMDEAEHPIEAYPTLDALFTRALKPGARPIDTDPNALVSPSDSRIAFAGRAKDGRIALGAGKGLDLTQLVGTPVDADADCMVLYLSPQDYHRVHSPSDGPVIAWRYLPGTLWPVFPAAVAAVENLFAINERMTVVQDTPHGELHSVLVGAFGVGRIELTCTDVISNTQGKAKAMFPEPGLPMSRGDHLGTFHLGSTVVLVAPGGTWNWTASVGDKVKVGQVIAHRMV